MDLCISTVRLDYIMKMRIFWSWTRKTLMGCTLVSKVWNWDCGIDFDDGTCFMNYRISRMQSVNFLKNWLQKEESKTSTIWLSLVNFEISFKPINNLGSIFPRDYAYFMWNLPTIFVCLRDNLRFLNVTMPCLICFQIYQAWISLMHMWNYIDTSSCSISLLSTRLCQWMC